MFMAEGEDLDNSLEFSDIVLLVWDTCKYGKEATLPMCFKPVKNRRFLVLIAGFDCHTKIHENFLSFKKFSDLSRDCGCLYLSVC